MRLFSPIITLSIILLIQQANAQALPRRINVDNLGNVYIVKENKITKFDSENKLLATYSGKSQGYISSIDVADPFRIIVFYSDFGQIVFLDNTLSVIQGPIALNNSEFPAPTLVCNAPDKSIWVYDKQWHALAKLNENLQTTLLVKDLHVILEPDFAPVFMQSYGNNIYLTDPRYGLFIFDFYGALTRRLHLKNIFYFDVENNTLYFSEDSVIKAFNLLSLTDIQLTHKDTLKSSFTIKNNFIYFINSNDITYNKLKLSFK